MVILELSGKVHNMILICIVLLCTFPYYGSRSIPFLMICLFMVNQSIRLLMCELSNGLLWR